MASKGSKASKEETALVNKVIKLYGPVIDLRANPGAIIDIMRMLAEGPPDGGNPCGGVPSPPPSALGEPVSNEELMKAILKLSRDVNTIKGAMPKTKLR